MKNTPYITTATAIFLTDMYLKYRTEKWDGISHDDGQKRQAGRFFIRKKVHNRGLPMSIASEHQGKVAMVSLLATIVLTGIYILTLKKSDEPLHKLGLSLQIGGAYSNTCDRLYRKYVVDFFSFNVPGRLGSIVFNIADIAIILGSILTLISTFFRSHKTGDGSLSRRNNTRREHIHAFRK
jgi:signal peptidase II